MYLGQCFISVDMLLFYGGDANIVELGQNIPRNNLILVCTVYYGLSQSLLLK